MAYRPRDIYKGRRKFRVPLTIFLSLLAFLVVGSVVLFYGLQRFIVYDQTGVTLQLPFSQTDQPEEVTADTVPTFQPIEVQVIYEDPDFTQVDLGGWEDLEAEQLRFLDYKTVTDSVALATAITSAAGDYSGVVLEVKSSLGQLAWASGCETALAYGTSGSTDLAAAVQSIHDQGLRAVAQISCCADRLLADRNWTVTLQTIAGTSYRDEKGTAWLDPYNRTVRNYLADLMEELSAIGFDEILLADLYHPISDTGFTYSTSLQTAPNPVTAVCQMGRRLVENLEGTGTAVSVLVDESSLLNGAAASTGQDIEIFWRLFARIYCPTNLASASDNKVLAIESMAQGDADVRFVPVSSAIPGDFDSYCIRTISD